MSILTIVAKVVAKKDHIEAVKVELLKMIVPTRQENGCINYHLHQDNDDPSVFIFYENWESLGCLEKHMNTDHFKTYIGAVDGMIAEKIVNKMNRIE